MNISPLEQFIDSHPSVDSLMPALLTFGSCFIFIGASSLVPYQAYGFNRFSVAAHWDSIFMLMVGTFGLALALTVLYARQRGLARRVEALERAASENTGPEARRSS
ncbi:MAG: hypothetical protein P4L33_22350 [Capsulimonadaceae bacterium]|nr:hypothetical protein [Capsulimonadaceae bacterium]